MVLRPTRSTRTAPRFPYTALFRANLGAITFNAGDYAKAAAAFKKLIELQPDNADAKSNLAAALAQQGNPAEAAALVQQRIAAAEAAGQAVPEGLYKQALALAYEARSPPSLEGSEERRVGKGGVSTCRSRGAPDN